MWLWSGVFNGEDVVILAGQANKNRMAFERDFEKVRDALNETEGENS
jgi:hypothetical protein